MYGGEWSEHSRVKWEYKQVKIIRYRHIKLKAAYSYRLQYLICLYSIHLYSVFLPYILLFVNNHLSTGNRDLHTPFTMKYPRSHILSFFSSFNNKGNKFLIYFCETGFCSQKLLLSSGKASLSGLFTVNILLHSGQLTSFWPGFLFQNSGYAWKKIRQKYDTPAGFVIYPQFCL